MMSNQMPLLWSRQHWKTKQNDQKNSFTFCPTAPYLPKQTPIICLKFHF